MNAGGAIETQRENSVFPVSVFFVAGCCPLLVEVRGGLAVTGHRCEVTGCSGGLGLNGKLVMYPTESKFSTLFLEKWDERERGNYRT